jgi:antitoxin component HigA of HigAB toxin-antitoxin module
LVVAVDFEKSIVWIKWIGTHKDYDKIDVKEVRQEIIGTRTRIAEVLNRKRGLSIAMIRRLHERLGVSADVLIRPSRKSAA